jgi:hypothetical protein
MNAGAPESLIPLQKQPSAFIAYVSVNADVSDCVLMSGELERQSLEGV